MLRVSRDKNDIVIRLHADALEPEALMRLLDLVNHEIRRPNSIILASEQPAPPPKRMTSSRRKRKRQPKPTVLDQLELPFARVS